jgi:hypothetical protein
MCGNVFAELLPDRERAHDGAFQVDQGALELLLVALGGGE